MFAIGFVGPSGVGKTTLMEKVLARLKSRGRRVSAVKSAHHTVDVDRPGKDSYRFRTAGAQEVLLIGPGRWALMRETALEPTLQEALELLSPVDIVLVEGYKSEEGLPRILVHRSGLQTDPLTYLTPEVVAIATDDAQLTMPAGIQRLDLNNPGAVANFIVGLKANCDHI